MEPSPGRIVSSMGSGTFSLSFNRFMMVLTAPLLAGPRHCSVEVGEQALAVRMGVGGWMFKAEVPRDSIAEVAAVSGPVMGWRGRWLVNGSSQGLVRVRINPRSPGRCLGVLLRIRELTLSLDDPAGFIDTLQPARG